MLSRTKKFSRSHYVTYCIPLERFFNADSKTYGRFCLKMDWERVIRHFSNLQTRLLLAQQKNLIGLQYMSCYIPLESIFSTDSKTHYNIYLKMDWGRVISHRSNIQTRLLAQPKNIFDLLYMSCTIRKVFKHRF